ncbi:hypothetical protein LEMLEM_LOCUS4272, partial [Lemmus lemmus]
WQRGRTRAVEYSGSVEDNGFLSGEAHWLTRVTLSWVLTRSSSLALCHPLEFHGLLSRRRKLQIIKSRSWQNQCMASFGLEWPLPASSITSTPKTPLLSSSQSTPTGKLSPLAATPAPVFLILYL